MKRFQPKTFHDACLPVLTFSWISGTAIIKYPSGRRRLFLSNMFVAFNLISFAAMLYLHYRWNISKLLNDNEFNKLSFHIINVISTVLSMCSGVVSFRHRKAPERYIARIQGIDDSLEKFGIAKNYYDLYISHLYQILQMFIILEFLTAANITVLFTNGFSITLISLVTLVMHHLTLVMYITDMNIQLVIEHIGKRFQLLNHLLEGYANKEFYATEAERRQVFDPSASSKIHRVIKSAREIHLELTKVSQVINVNCGFQMLLSISLVFLIITWMLYHTAIKILQKKINLDEIFDPNGIQLIAWFILYVKKSMMIIGPCAETKKESRKTGDVIYRLGDTSRDHTIRKEVQDFFLQITQHPVVFSAHGFFNLDYMLIRRMIGSVTTYLVILIQVDDIKSVDNSILLESFNQALNISSQKH